MLLYDAPRILKLRESFDNRVMLPAWKMCHGIRQIIMHLESISTETGIIKTASKSHEGHSYITSAFDSLCEKSESCKTATENFQSHIKVEFEV